MTIPKPQNKKKFYQRWWFWLLVTFVLLGGGSTTAVLLLQDNQELAVDMISDTIEVERRDLKKTVSTTGKIVPEHSEQLSFTMTGKTTKINYKLGDQVNKDDELIEIDGGSYARHADEVIKAPFDGRILAVNTFIDDAVMPGISVVEIGYRTNFVEFTASESEVFELKTGQIVDITIPSYNNGNTTYHGVVESIDTVKTTSDAVSQMTGQASSTEVGFIVKVRPTDVPAEVMNLIGLTVDLDVIVAEQANLISLENAAIQYDEDNQPFVYLPTTDQTATELPKQNVTLGFETNEYVEIVDGLNEGVEVVLYIPQANASSPF
ncbi:MAG: Biotin/lipoyl attachment protein [uncultured bacterium]|nr:MAG: Biotin/lipoyl attachment protein [uncultured bacterium]